MKLLHLSDLHIGKRVSGFSMVADQRIVLEQVLSICADRAVDVLLVAGDIYDKAAPSAEAVTVFDAFLTRLSAAGVRVIAVPGNHDSAERVSYAQSLLANQGVWFPPVFDGRVERVVLEDEFGDVAFWPVPFLKPADVRRFFPEVEIGDDYAAALRAVFDACEIDTTCRNVVLSHQLVTAGAWGPERADDEIKLGGIDNVDISVYDEFDYVALGHVHRPQRVGRDTARYSGSLLKYSFSEINYSKSAVLVELGEKTAGQQVGECASVELVSLEPARDMRELRGTLADVVASATANAAGAEDYLRVVLTDEFPSLDALARLRDVYPNVMALEYAADARDETDRPQRDVVDPEKADMVELFARFYEEQLGTPMDEEQADLVEKLARGVGETQASGERREEGGAR